MIKRHMIINSIAIAILMFASCGAGQQQGESNSKEKTSKNTNLPDDPCELVFHVISTLNKGPETLEAAILNVDDFNKLKKDFPDLETYYDLWENFFQNTPDRFPISRALQMIYLEKKAEEKGISFSDMFDDFLKDYYSMFREGAINEEWIWDEIKLNDCSHRNDRSRYDWLQILNDDGSYREVDESEYSLPEIWETTVYIIINGEITHWEFRTVKTNKGWKLFMPYLHWLNDEMGY
jgi:hypothetical protein